MSKRWADVAADTQLYVIQRMKTEISDLRLEKAKAVDAIRWPEAVQMADERIEAFSLAIEELYLAYADGLARAGLEGEALENSRALAVATTPPDGTAIVVGALEGELARAVAPCALLEGAPLLNGQVVRHRATGGQHVVTSIQGEWVYCRGKGPFRIGELARVV